MAEPSAAGAEKKLFSLEAGDGRIQTTMSQHVGKTKWEYEWWAHQKKLTAMDDKLHAQLPKRKVKKSKEKLHARLPKRKVSKRQKKQFADANEYL